MPAAGAAQLKARCPCGMASNTRLAAAGSGFAGAGEQYDSVSCHDAGTEIWTLPESIGSQPFGVSAVSTIGAPVAGRGVGRTPEPLRLATTRAGTRTAARDTPATAKASGRRRRTT